MLQRSQNKPLGNKGEEIASDILVKNGYKIIDKNYSSRFGEIDIIAIDKDTLVFVEVKTRQSLKFGLPQEAVTPQKIYKIKKTGEYYSLIHPDLPKKLRVDVVAIVIENGNVVYNKIIRVF